MNSKHNFLDNEGLRYLLRAHVRVLFEVSVAQGGALVTAQGLGGQQAKKQTKKQATKTIKKQAKSKQKAKSFKVTAQGLGGQQAKKQARSKQNSKQKASKKLRASK